MTIDIGVIVDMTTAGTAPVPSTDLPIAAPHTTGAPVHTTTIGTLPTAELLLAVTPPEMTADPDMVPDNASTNQPEDPQQLHRHHLTNIKTENKNINRSLLMIHQSEYYSSDESETNSEDDLN